jgi:hypothetical protein
MDETHEDFIERYITKPDLSNKAIIPRIENDVDDLGFCPTCGTSFSLRIGKIPTEPVEGFLPKNLTSEDIPDLRFLIDALKGIVVLTEQAKSHLNNIDGKESEAYRKMSLTQSYFVGHIRKAVSILNKVYREKNNG